jgi:DNA modification methylase
MGREGGVMSGAVTVRVMSGNCVEILRGMAAGSVDCVVTSPPYWGLRDYGIGGVEWDAVEYAPLPGGGVVRVGGGVAVLGLEESMEAFIGHLVLVFREVRRVLKDGGNCWVNMGDKWASAGGAGVQGGGGQRAGRRHTQRTLAKGVGDGIKAKDLMGQPWRLAFALQADGWWLREEVIWHKRNPMPESAGDRCTRAHEQVFHLTKGARYYWDRAAMAEPVSGGAHARGRRRAKRPDGWDVSVGKGGHGSIHREGRGENDRVDGVNPKAAANAVGARQNASFSAAVSDIVGTRNKRSVWSLVSEPCRDAHFATFPRELIRPMIRAGCPEGGVVLDPFGGSGTTGVVALEEGRSAVLCEANPEYLPIIERRLSGVQGRLSLKWGVGKPGAAAS